MGIDFYSMNHDDLKALNPEDLASDHVFHCRMTNREKVVAVRPTGNGDVRLTFSHPSIDLRGSGETVATKFRAIRLIRNFFHSDLHVTRPIGWKHFNDFEMFINQANRDCWIESLAGTTARVGYEMPNAGEVGRTMNAVLVGERHLFLSERF